MTFYAFGLNFETAPVGLRESYALGEQEKRTLYRSLPDSFASEVILLSTCNRTEGYLYGTAEDVETVQRMLAVAAGQPWPADAAFRVQDEQAVRHVLEVTTGLRSVVLGDAQILGQVKEAYRIADDEDRVGTVLHRLMHTAFRTAKRVVSETQLTNGAVSVSSAAVALARAHVEAQGHAGLEGCRALLVGAGQMGCLALQALASYRPAALQVTNRSPERARLLADTVGASVVDWEARHAAAAEADVVIVATGASEPTLRADLLPARDAARPAALMIDIAVPRNIDPAVAQQAGYLVLDLDALQTCTQQTEEARRAEVPAARRICEETMSEFVAWVFHQQALQPTIQAIRDTFDQIRVQEIERHHHRFAETDRAELDHLTRSIMQKLLAIPVVRLKSADPESIDFVRGIQLLQRLFSRPGCDDDTAAQAPPRLSAPSVEAPAPQCPFEPSRVRPDGEEAAALVAFLRSAHPGRDGQARA